jgi:hypothetical protein
MSICQRGYATARKYYYPFPSYEAMDHAHKVCQGEEPDYTGLKEKSKYNNLDIKINDINGFSRRHAEAWIDVCTMNKCLDYRSSTCHPSKRIDPKTSMTITEMSPEHIKDLCENYRPSYPDINTLLKKLHRSGFVPSKQITYDGQSIGILDTNNHLHISQPSAPIDSLTRVQLQ